MVVSQPARQTTSLAARARLICAIAVATWILCAAATVAPASAAGLPPQGLYEWCAPYQPQPQCANDLAQMAGAGFRLVLNYGAWYGDPAQVLAYASEAQTYGIKVIWPLDDSAWRDPGSATSLLSTYSTLAPDCGCSSNAGFIPYAISLVRSLPVTWGYYIGDELDPSQAPAVASLAAQVRALDPGHPLLYVGDGSSNLTSTLQPFESIANVVGADIYPIGTGASVSAVGPVADTVGQLSRASGALPVMALQAFSWSEYPGTQTAPASWPTESEMESMRDEALDADPSMILWYSMYDILNSDDPAGHWQDLVQAAFAPLPSAQSDPQTPSTTGSGKNTKDPSAREASLARTRKRHRRHRRHRHHHHAKRQRHKHHRRAARRRRTAPLTVLDYLRLLVLF